jgi:hypothetical protein
MKSVLICLFVFGLTCMSAAGHPSPRGPGILLAPLTPAEKNSDTFYVNRLRQQEVKFSDAFWKYLYIKFMGVRI